MDRFADVEKCRSTVSSGARSSEVEVKMSQILRSIARSSECHDEVEKLADAIKKCSSIVRSSALGRSGCARRLRIGTEDGIRRELVST
jgi:hypothetical protein